MSPLIHKVLSSTAAVAVPVGIAAVFAFQAPAAYAAPAASSRQVTETSQLGAMRPHTALMSAHRRRHHRSARRLRAYRWAARQHGHPYVWGGTGPGFDCSGLVMMAYLHVGVHLPRTTTEMLGSRLLVRVRHPRMGDLAFYGTGHVELFRRWGYTFGAHDSGSVVSLIHYGWGWKPTAYYRVR